MDDQAKAIAAALTEQLAVVLRAQHEAQQDRLSENLLISLDGDVKRLKEDVTALKSKVYSDHDPIVIWGRGVMDSYRKVITVIIASGLITVIGLLIQLYNSAKK